MKIIAKVCDARTRLRWASAKCKPYHCDVEICKANFTGALLRTYFKETISVIIRFCLSNQRFETAAIDSCKTPCSTQVVFHSGFRLLLCNFERMANVKKFCQWLSRRIPPVPIPNTIVKTSSADNTRRVASREDRSLLTPNLRRPWEFSQGLFATLTWYCK